MWFPAGVAITCAALGTAAAASQVPLTSSLNTLGPSMSSIYTPDFTFKEGANLFTPKDLVELIRPGTGLANPAGDLVLVPASKYSIGEKK